MLCWVIILYRFNPRYGAKCKLTPDSDDCIKTYWTLKGIPNGKYEVTIDVKDTLSISIVHLVVN